MMKLLAIAITSWCFLHTAMGASMDDQILQPFLKDSLISEDGHTHDYQTIDGILRKYFPDPHKRNSFWEELEPAVENVAHEAAKEAVAHFMLNQRNGDVRPSMKKFRLPNIKFWKWLKQLFASGLADAATEAIVAAGINAVTGGSDTGSGVSWLSSAKCGPRNPLQDGSPAKCNPEGKYPCCNTITGWCGDTPKHCNCKKCIYYTVKN